MNQQTAGSGHQVDSGIKAEIVEVLGILNEMSDARNFGGNSESSVNVDKVAGRTVDMDAMFKELRRTLPATYFRNNSRVKRIFDQILEAHKCNRDELVELRQSSGPGSSVASTAKFLENLERVKRRLDEMLKRI